MNFRLPAIAVSATVALAFAATTAQAMTIDITATADLKSVVTFGAGTYQIDWIGQAGGGQYDGWSYNTATSGNWRNAFTLEINGATFTIDKPTATPFANFATAGDALAGFSSGPYYVYASGAPGSYQPSMLVGTVDKPTFTLTAPATVSFGIPDYAFGDNTNGVSLSVTAVPEPSTYALLLGGLAAVGGLVRRRMK